MSSQVIRPYKYDKLRSIFKYYIDPFIMLYQLKTEKEEELTNIYKIIKTDLIDSKQCLPQNIIRDILKIIPYNNRYTMSYLKLSKLISDDYHVKEVTNVEIVSNYLFYNEFGIKLDNSHDFNEIKIGNLDIHSGYTISRSIMDLSLIHI